MHKEAVKIFQLCTCQNIRLEPEWIPRERNELVDYINHIIDNDDWFLDPAVFAALDDPWGTHTVDRFSSHFMRKRILLTHVLYVQAWKQ